MSFIAISTPEFVRVRDLVYDLTGISLSDAKRTLVCGRLLKRLVHYSFGSFSEYLDLIVAPGSDEERQTFVNLMTTNETSFFREPRHFDFLRAEALPPLARSADVRVWSAACSTGEEPYTIAMVLAEARGMSGWEVVASDVSTRALDHAKAGHYAEDRNTGIPKHCLRKYCLKGVRSQAGTFAIDPALRERVAFAHLNLIESLPRLGLFDVIFLRNILIYFDVPTKAKVVSNVARFLKPGGYFMVGHCETLQAVPTALVNVQPAVYRNPA